MLGIIGLEHSDVFAKIANTNTRLMERRGHIQKKLEKRHCVYTIPALAEEV